jgi:hypothetical protein
MKKLIMLALVGFTLLPACKSTKSIGSSKTPPKFYRIEKPVFERLVKIESENNIPNYCFNEMGIIFYCDSIRDSIAREGITTKFYQIISRDSLILPPMTACRISGDRAQFVDISFPINFSESTISEFWTVWKPCKTGYYCRNKISRGRIVDQETVRAEYYNSNPNYYNSMDMNQLKASQIEDKFLRLKIDENSYVEKNGKRYFAKGLKVPVYLLVSLEDLSRFQGTLDVIQGVPIK